MTISPSKWVNTLMHPIIRLDHYFPLCHTPFFARQCMHRFQ